MFLCSMIHNFYKSHKSSLSAIVCLAGKENTLLMHSPPTSMTPPASKKRCRASLKECEDKITETPLPYPTFTTQQEQGVNKSAFNGVMFDICFRSLSSVKLLLTDKVAQVKCNQWMTCYLRLCGPHKLSGGVPVVSIVFFCFIWL